MSDFPEKFRFGLETEFFLAERNTFRPLWHPDLSFQKLDSILGKISLEGIESCEGLQPDPPHSHCGPFVVEGYHLYDEQKHPLSVQPKGVEIRTPICCSIQRCLDNHQRLFGRMQEALASENYLAVALSHHPAATQFRGERAHRSADFWKWAQEAMLTYGPDINISVPRSILDRMDVLDFSRKVNYYAPALTALTVASPFYGGELWKVAGDVGKSYRTFRRSAYAPAIKIHGVEEGHRIEFKFFEMAHTLQEFEGYFLLCLALILDDELQGRSEDAKRMIQLQEVARLGMDVPGIALVGEEVLMSAYRVLPGWGFSTHALDGYACRWQSRWTPADRMIEQYLNDGNWKRVFFERSRLFLDEASAALAYA